MSTAPPPRQGPRPLPLQLLTAIGLWSSSRAAWPWLRNGSLPWSLGRSQPGLALQSALQSSLAAADAEAFAAALDRELCERATRFLAGIARYRHHPYRRALADPPVVWQDGTTRLLDYAPGGGVPLLVVPSLINRAYILDLAPGKSLLRWLAGEGIRPLLVDWGAPGALERGFGLTEYVAGRLEAAAEAAAEAAGAPLAAMGYCMGGLLALALAARRPRLVGALALLATPWSFHTERVPQARLLGGLSRSFALACAGLGELPVDLLQALFLAVDPLVSVRKFQRFAALGGDSPAAHLFVALEDWLNDGVPLALPVARECLGGWYGEDSAARGLWRIAGRVVRPEDVRAPSLVMVPAQDRIVPPEGAAALGAALPHAETVRPPFGHIGMIVGSGAEGAVWRPLARWLKRHVRPGSQSRRGGLSRS